jgi:hypothetical protein
MKVIPIKTHRITHTRSDTLLVTKDVIDSWKKPPFQRDLRVNEKVLALVDDIKKDGGVLPGFIVLGYLDEDTYILDGQHRAHAFLLSGLEEGYADVRTQQFKDMGEMGEEFVRLNSHLVSLRPDDVLKGLEASNDAMRLIRQKCPFVGYEMVKRDERGPILSMSALLRCWTASQNDTPTPGNMSAAKVVKGLTTESSGKVITFLQVAERAWGKDKSYWRLWSTLNLTLCMWFWNKAVMESYSPRVTKVSPSLFQKLLMSLSADDTYLDWLHGRNNSERDRSPGWSRMMTIFRKRIQEETGVKAILPSPLWAKGHGDTGR